MKLTIYKETHRHNTHGFTSVVWHCGHCHKKIDLPQQQNISYCPHCGAKIIKKIGGKVNPRPTTNQEV